MSFHSLRVEGDPTEKINFFPTIEFQSTPSVRRETIRYIIIGTLILNISIHSLRAEGDGVPKIVNSLRSAISIHSLRAEGDGIQSLRSRRISLFQSTPSVRRETQRGRCSAQELSIFQSTPSVRRETLVRANLPEMCGIFQSTPSVRRETLRHDLCAIFTN